jgi:short-subunit dehydrogenase
MSDFASKYGPWALVVGASDGVGEQFVRQIAARGINVAMVARRRTVLDEVADAIRGEAGVQTRTVAVDLTAPSAASDIIEAVADVSVGLLVYVAGADPNYTRFLASPVEDAEALLQRNCVSLMRLVHHFAQPMAAAARGGLVILTSGAALAGGPNMVAYSATKAFDLLFAEALWAELHPRGVDVLALILGKTDTPALRELEYRRGRIGSLDAIPEGAVAAEIVVTEAMENIANGPTLAATDELRFAEQFLRSVSRKEAVQMVTAASEQMMGSDMEDR